MEMEAIVEWLAAAFGILPQRSCVGNLLPPPNVEMVRDNASDEDDVDDESMVVVARMLFGLPRAMIRCGTVVVMVVCGQVWKIFYL